MTKSEKQLQHSFKYKTRIKQKTLITKGVKQYFKGFLTVKAFVRELHIDHRTVEVFGLGSYFDRLNRGDQLSDRDRMQYEWLRLASFQHYTGNGNALYLARNGFYHDRTDGPTSTRCYLCGARHSSWGYFDNIDAEHRRQFPDCRFHVNHNEESTNVSISYENSGQELRGPNGSSTRHNTSRSSPTVLPFSGVSNPRESSYCRYSGMLSSVRMNMHASSTTNMSVIEALRSRSEPRRRGRVAGDDGDFPLSEPSLPVRATPSERVLGLQLRDTLSCSARMSSDTNTHSLVSPPALRTSSQQRTDNLGPNEHLLAFNHQVMTRTNSSSSDRICTDQIVTNNNSSLGHTQPSIGGGGVTEVVENPKHLGYRELDARISSYRRWPDYLDQTSRRMAEAGFFFVGVADFTICFCCGGGLKNWDPGDDPMLEHTRWFPRCEYVNKLKGETYVAAVQRRHQQHMAEQQRQQSVATQRTDVSRIPPNPITTEAAAVLREMGYQQERINETILAVRRQKGATDVTTQQVFEWLMDQQEETTGQKEDSEKLRETLTCKICTQRPVNTTFLPCGHLVTCDICADRLRHCPICRKEIRRTVKTYMS